MPAESWNQKKALSYEAENCRQAEVAGIICLLCHSHNLEMWLPGW
jgi:hypothetical protein